MRLAGLWWKDWREWGRRGGGAVRVWLVHSQPAAASESVMSPEATEAQAQEVKVQLGLWALEGHLLRAVLVAVDHCAAELAAGLRERSAIKASRGH